MSQATVCAISRKQPSPADFDTAPAYAKAMLEYSEALCEPEKHATKHNQGYDFENANISEHTQKAYQSKGGLAAVREMVRF